MIPWAALRFWLLKTCDKDSFLFIVNNLWWYQTNESKWIKSKTLCKTLKWNIETYPTDATTDAFTPTIHTHYTITTAPSKLNKSLTPRYSYQPTSLSSLSLSTILSPYHNSVPFYMNDFFIRTHECFFTTSITFIDNTFVVDLHTH